MHDANISLQIVIRVMRQLKMDLSLCEDFGDVKNTQEIEFLLEELSKASGFNWKDLALL